MLGTTNARHRVAVLSPVLVTLVGLLLAIVVLAAPPTATAAGSIFEGPVPRAECGPGSLPETDLQGRIPRADRDSGRSQEGYRCNLELLGQYQGQGTTWVSQSYRTCAYHGQAAPTSLGTDLPGVHVVDVADPAAPVLSTRLTSPAFLGNPWESMKVNPRRGLLAGTFVGSLIGTGSFDVYDVGADCAQPRLLNSVAGSDLGVGAGATLLAHEGGWSPDGNTYWSTGGQPGVVTAIDVTDTSVPSIVFSGLVAPNNHGLAISEDGTRLYLASIDPTGLRIFDVSEVQARQSDPQVTELGSVFWDDGDNGMQPTLVSYDGRSHVLFVDELGGQVAKIIDVGEEIAPQVVAKLKLEIHMDEASDARAEDLGDNGTDNGLFGYEAHYCAVDRIADPTMAACGYFSSGVRVFDIRDPHAPREIGYFNPPAQVGRAGDLPGSEHAQGVVGGGGSAAINDMTTDWCSSPPRFVGRDQLWVHCQDNGFLTLTFTNDIEHPLTPDAAVVRVGGTDRVATAGAVSRRTWSDGSTGTVVVARADDFADALSGGPLAAHLDAPLLLTATGSLSPETETEIQRLDASHIVVLGGTNAVSRLVEEQLQSVVPGAVVERLAGADRYATSALIARRMADVTGGSSAAALIVRGTGGGWADAVSAVPLAAVTRQAILLVDAEALPAATAAVISELGITAVQIVGGRAAVNQAVEEAVQALGVLTSRVSGSDRFATSAAVAEVAIRAGLSPTTVWLASGRTFADALTAGPAVAEASDVLVLVPPDKVPGASPARQFLMDHASSIDRLVVLGGFEAITARVADEAQRIATTD